MVRTLWGGVKRRRPFGELTIEEQMLRAWYAIAAIACRVRGHQWREWISADLSDDGATRTDMCFRCDATRDVQEPLPIHVVCALCGTVVPTGRACDCWETTL